MAQSSLKLKKSLLESMFWEPKHQIQQECRNWHQICAQTSEQVSKRTQIRGKVPENGCYSITQISHVQKRRAVIKLPLISDQLLPSLIAAVAELLVTCYISCRLSQKWLFFFCCWTLEWLRTKQTSWQNNDRKTQTHRMAKLLFQQIKL